MSTMSDALTVPVGMNVPAELEAAWTWMEDAGNWCTNTAGGYFLTPYAGTAQVGSVFTPTATLAGWFTPSMPGTERLLPFGEVDGSGSTVALWLTDDGSQRFVVLGSDGTKHVLARSPVDFLRLIAVGYPEISWMWLGAAPDDAEAVAAVAGFRTWVESTFDVTVPAMWPEIAAEDEFSGWVDARLAEAI